MFSYPLFGYTENNEKRNDIYIYIFELIEKQGRRTSYDSNDYFIITAYV